METIIVKRNRFKIALLLIICILMTLLGGLVFLMPLEKATQVLVPAIILEIIFIPVTFLMLWHLLTPKPWMVLDSDSITFYGSPFSKKYEWKELLRAHHTIVGRYTKHQQSYIDIQLENPPKRNLVPRKELIGEIQMHLLFAKDISYDDCVQLINRYIVASMTYKEKI